MKKLIIGSALIASLALPGIASAADRHEVRDAARECRAERSAMGAEQFRAEHRSLGRCIRSTVRENRREARSHRRQAVRECREQGLRGRELAQCIRSEVRSERAEQRQEERAERNAARECREERETMGEETFGLEYGTSQSNRRNAFGKCVSSKVSEREGDGETPAPEAEGQGGRPDGTGRPGHAGAPA